MTGAVSIILVLHLAMAALDLPPLWRDAGRRGERWAAIALLLSSLGLALLLTYDLHPPTIWRLIELLFEPIGTPLFRPARG